MKKQYVALVVGLAMVLAACGKSESADVVTAGSAEGAEQVTDGSADGGADDQAVSDDEGDAGSDAAGSSDEGAEATVVSVEDEEPTGETDGAPSGVPSSSDGELGTLRSVLLSNALDESSEISSARFEGRMTMVGAAGSQLEGDLSIVFSGAYDLSNDATEISVDLSGILAAAAEADPEAAAGLELFSGFFQDPMQVITVGDRSWMKWGLISLLTGAGDKWIEGEADQTSDLTSEFGFGGNGSPTGILDLLADANADVTEIGSEELRGVKTTHYRAIIDTKSLSATLSAEEQATLEAELGADSITELPMEFWLDDDGLLHRYILDISEAVMQDGGDEEFSGATFVFDMWDHGVDLGITPPPPGDVLTEDEISLDFGDFDLAG